MTTVGITGATGFVGSSLVRELVAQGKDVVAFARQKSDRGGLEMLPVRWAEIDITEPDSLIGVFAGIDWLVHAAGTLGRPGLSEQDYREVHPEGTDNVLSAANNCRRILHVSSPGVLGPIIGPPADEDSPKSPSNLYEKSKAAAEEVALKHASRGLPVVIARPEFIYGPGDRHVLGLFKSIKSGRYLYINGGQNFCHPTFIDDAVDGLIRCLREGAPGEIYHITGPRPVTFRELTNVISDELQVKRPRYSLPRPLAILAAGILETLARFTGTVPAVTRTAVSFFSEDRRFSWAKASQDLGYRPRVDLAEGVRRTIEWYRDQDLI